MSEGDLATSCSCSISECCPAWLSGLILLRVGQHVHGLLQAPISFELIPMSEGDLGAEDGRQTVRILMRNKHYFAGTAGLQLHFRLLLDGLPLRMGDPLQQDPEAWLPGGSTHIAPQVCHALGNRQREGFL